MQLNHDYSAEYKTEAKMAMDANKAIIDYIYHNTAFGHASTDAMDMPCFELATAIDLAFIAIYRKLTS